ncbi:MAG: type I phosphomannose isomerase catalytic subunit [Terriglobia bacterium]
MALFALRPEFHARPWGRHELAPLYERPAGSTDPIGEVWLTSLECRVQGAASPRAEETLAELWARLSATERGAALAQVERFPLLVKFLFTSEKLSIQVHPGDDYARRHEGEPWGKSETWHVVAAAPEAAVYVGVNPDISRAQLAALFAKPQGLERALVRHPLQAGDQVYVPAGTLHTIGPGLVLCEIQQYSDLTYRVYDYDRLGLDARPRALHLEKARAVVRHPAPEAGRVKPRPLAGGRGRLLVTSPYFAVEKYEATEPLALPREPAHFDLLVFCAGQGRVATARDRAGYQAGAALLVTADAGPVEVLPSSRSELLRAYVPQQTQGKS